MEIVCSDDRILLTGNDYYNHSLTCPLKYPHTCHNLIDFILKKGEQGYRDVVHEMNKHVKKEYHYLITFTLDPSKGPFETDLVEKYICKLLTSKSLKLIVADVVYEIGASDNSHWHAYARSLTPLKKNRFSTYINRYGNVDISKSKSQDSSHILTYLNKENTSKSLISL